MPDDTPKPMCSKRGQAEAGPGSNLHPGCVAIINAQTLQGAAVRE
ncbi:hypothetical protein [Amycolatopsis vastitatis]|nr:hypothetical protein [Amycolatopsis vastitatis]